MSRTLTPEQRAEMIRDLYEYGLFEPTLLMLHKPNEEAGEIVGHFCLNEEATKVATEIWMTPVEDRRAREEDRRNMQAICRYCNSHIGEAHTTCEHPMCECVCMDPAPGEPKVKTIDFMETEV